MAVAVAAALICLLVYLRALSCDFVNYDDPNYVVLNPAIRLLDWGFIVSAFTTSYMGWWMPLTWISFAVDYRFWGLNPLGFHLTNIVLHAINTGLVVLIADKLLGKVFLRTSSGNQERGNKFLYPGMLLLAGLLFGIHPLRVESVAWVTERKDVLSGVFSLASILFYLRYAEKRDSSEGAQGAVKDYAISAVSFVLALMAKPVSVVIPAMLLVADWYPLGRFRKGKALPFLVEKVPYLLLSAAIVVATLYSASGETILVSLHDFPLYRRTILAGYALVEYCRMALYPVGLVHLYLLPRIFPVTYYVAAAGSAIFTWYCFHARRKRPVLLATWLAFVLPLIPVLGFFQNGAQAYAARFTYLPSVAPAIAVAALVAVAYRKLASAHRFPCILLAVSAVTVLVFCGSVTERLIGSWKNPETLWSRLIAIRPVGRAYYLRADYRLRNGRYLAAADDLRISIQMGKGAGFPGVFDLEALRGDALYKAGRYAEAAQEFTEAIRLNPQPNYFYHRGLALAALGKKKEAEADFLLAGDDTGPVKWLPYQ